MRSWNIKTNLIEKVSHPDKLTATIKNIQPQLETELLFFTSSIVATTRHNGTCDMLTSAKLSDGYLVVGIIRELDKEPSLYCSSIYINYRWSMLQQYLLALMFMPLPHVHYSSTMRLPQGHHTMSMCPDIILFNLHHTCVHHVYTMRNPCPLTLLLTLIPI